jgi:hypothetical protein
LVAIASGIRIPTVTAGIDAAAARALAAIIELNPFNLITVDAHALASAEKAAALPVELDHAFMHGDQISFDTTAVAQHDRVRAEDCGYPHTPDARRREHADLLHRLNSC